MNAWAFPLALRIAPARRAAVIWATHSENKFRKLEAVMGLSYEDLIEPAIVRQVSKSVAYCRCTRTKNPPFCDGSHAVTSITPRILEFNEPTTVAICRCWKSKDHPYCDGTHGRLVKPK